MNDPVKDALLWYADQANAVARYSTDGKVVGLTAIVKSLELDAGKRAIDALEIHTDTTKKFLGIILEGEPLRMPTSVLEAEWMEKIGFAFLKEHAPERLTPEAQSRPIPQMETEPRLPHSFHVIMNFINLCADAARKGDMALATEMSEISRRIEELFPEGKAAVDRIYPLNREGDGQ